MSDAAPTRAELEGLLWTLLVAARTTVRGARDVRRLGRAWDEHSELGDVRARRPHAPERDRELAHDEYAVTVEDDGRLFVWRFSPLAVTRPVPDGHVPVPGRPRYAATVVEQRDLSPDPARAAERLADTQEHAARLEEQARARASERHELQTETSSTAAALRHLTGQSR
jgi:hypothetical protein